MNGATSSKFIFERDFSTKAAQEAKQAEAEARGYQAGLAEGRRQAEADIQARLAQSLDRLGRNAIALIQQLDSRLLAMEHEALHVADLLARRIAGEALEQQPLAALEETARRALHHVRGVPHLVVRVNEALVEQVDPMIQRLAREAGYEGRLVVMGEPRIALGDAQMEWADGGALRSRTEIEAQINILLNNVQQERA